jgi:hypothetical protein
MEKIKEAESKKKGLFDILKESILKTSEGCGPDCGCHVEEGRAQAESAAKSGEKAKK